MPRQLFDLVTGGAVAWQKMASPFEKFVYPDFTFDVPPDERAYREALCARFPEERAGIERYFKDLRAAAGWYGARIVAGSLPAVLGAFMRGAMWRYRPLALGTTKACLDRCFRNPQLKAVLASQWGDYGLPPSQSAFAIHALVVGSYLKGGYYPVGGAGTIAKAVVPIVEGNGGQCLASHTVTEIVVSGGRAAGVRVVSGRGHARTELAFSAPVIVSDAGAYTTFCRLLPQDVPLPFRAELERRAAGPGLVTVYLGLTESPAALGFRGENHWIYAGYDHDALFQQRHTLLEGRPTACYLSLQSLKDPQARAHTAQIISFLDYSQVEAFKDQPWRHRGEQYQLLKERVADGLLEFVEQHYPGFRELVNYREVSTPLTVETFTGHLRGTVYGVPATPERLLLPYLTPTTPVRNLYLTGADVGSLGIMGSLMGGAATAGRLLGGLGFFRIMGAARKGAVARGQLAG